MTGSNPCFNEDIHTLLQGIDHNLAAYAAIREFLQYIITSCSAVHLITAALKPIRKLHDHHDVPVIGRFFVGSFTGIQGYKTGSPCQGPADLAVPLIPKQRPPD